MELNINSPAYFTQQYGVNERVYYYCKKCHEYFKDKEYSEILKVIGICPQCAPKDLYQKGMWKEKVRFIGNGSCASVDIRIDFDQYYNPVFDSCTYKNPSKILIYSAFFEGLFA